MKRFYKEVAVRGGDGGWQVTLDGRPVKSQGGTPQVLPSRALAEALAAEWAAQDDEIDLATFMLRDLADYAIDAIGQDRSGTISGLLGYAETDTLCYRAEDGEALHLRQIEVWEPLLTAAEARWDIHFERISGIMHRPQPDATLARLQAVLEAEDAFSLAALTTLTALAASLVIALAALAPEADAEALWAAANLEEDWQAELWGKDAEAEARREKRHAAFRAAQTFARLART